jgi:formate hydrogenlyase subunit 3/multisubunit Na+/H+ antiporter MnhD subunit
VGSKFASKVPRRLSLAATGAASVLLCVFAAEVLLSGTSVSLVGYQLAAGFTFSFLVDRLAAFFLLLIGIVSFSVAVYSFQYLEHQEHENRKNLIVSFMNLFIASMTLVIASWTMFSFLFFWEIMAISSFLR